MTPSPSPIEVVVHNSGGGGFWSSIGGPALLVALGALFTWLANRAGARRQETYELAKVDLAARRDLYVRITAAFDSALHDLAQHVMILQGRIDEDPEPVSKRVTDDVNAFTALTSEVAVTGSLEIWTYLNDMDLSVGKHDADTPSWVGLAELRHNIDAHRTIALALMRTDVERLREHDPGLALRAYDWLTARRLNRRLPESTTD